MPTSVVADVALALTLALFVELLFRLRRADGPTPPWWIGYARDGTNVGTAMAAWGAYFALGYAPATAFMAASLTTLTAYMIDSALGRRLDPRQTRAALAATLAAWVTLVAVWPTAIGHVFASLVSSVQPTAR